MQVGTYPARFREQRMGAGERPQSPLYCRFEIGGCAALRELNGGLYDRQ
jgi:hypothetical protein